MWALTFFLYPGVATMKQFQIPSLQENNRMLGILIMMSFYNLGDFCGEYIGSKAFFKSTCFYISLVFLRIINVIVFIKIAKQSDNFLADEICFANIFIFAILGGTVSSGLMTLASRKSHNKDELEIIGFINIFMLTFGIQ